MRNEILNVVASLVPTDERFKFLPKLFGESLMLVGENSIYRFMDQSSPDYNCAYWNYYELSNGGFYMAPASPNELSLVLPGNYFDGKMSCDAAGITATLFVLCRLWEQFENDRLATAYQKLHEYIRYHPESSKIYQAID